MLCLAIREAVWSKLEQFHMDIAASIQEVTEEVVIKLSRSIAKETACKNLCLAGGVLSIALLMEKL